MKTTLRNSLKLLILPLLFALAVACSTPTPETVEVEKIVEVEVEAAPGKLIIYAGRSESLVQPIIDQFAAATGIDVEVRYGSTSEMAGLLLTEGDASPADLFYAQDPGGIGAVAEAGLFSTLPSDITDQVPTRFAADNGSWIGISGRARVVVYNSDEITDPTTELPQDMMGFTGPEWEGRIGWAPTNGSFQAMVTGMRATWGEDQTREWLAGIQANNPTVYPKNTPTVEAVGNGEVSVGFVNHYYLYRFTSAQGDSFAARNYFLPSGGPGSLIMVSGAGVLASAENASNAEQFINFLLSVPGQQYFTSQTFEYPVIEGVTTIGGLQPLEELDAVAIDISLNDMSDLQGTQDMLFDLGIIE